MRSSHPNFHFAACPSLPANIFPYVRIPTFVDSKFSCVPSVQKQCSVPSACSLAHAAVLQHCMYLLRYLTVVWKKLRANRTASRRICARSRSCPGHALFGFSRPEFGGDHGSDCSNSGLPVVSNLTRFILYCKNNVQN
jgi:hypothetical protein